MIVSSVQLTPPRGAERVGVAPVNWGVCEAPGWGVQVDPLTVFQRLNGLNVASIELGPPGWVSRDAVKVAAVLARRGLTLMGAFDLLPADCLERNSLDMRRDMDARFRFLKACNVPRLVVSVALDSKYNKMPRPSASWLDRLSGLLSNLVRDACDLGLELLIHPHFGTAIEGQSEVYHVLDSSDIGLCLDTGHYFLAGEEPRDLILNAGERLKYVHLKDVDGSLAKRVRGGELAYMDAVASGLYTSLGQGDVGISTLVRDLEARNYRGNYLIEEDVRLSYVTEEQLACRDSSVRQSLDLLDELLQPGRRVD